MDIGGGVTCCTDMKSSCRLSTATPITATSQQHDSEVVSNNYINQAKGSHHSTQSNGIQDGRHSETAPESCRKWSLLPPIVPTISRDEVPVLFREEHVKRGFRMIHQPWSYYICSIFQLHNESMNVWTHIVASVLLSYKLADYASQIDFASDPHSWPLLAGLLSSITLYTFSSAAHCLQSKSELVHYVTFMFDYTGIGLYGLGSVVMHHWYCSEPSYYELVKYYYLPAGTLLAFLITCCCTIAKLCYARPYPPMRKVWQMSPVGGIYALLIMPILHRLFACYIYGEGCTANIAGHLSHIVWFFFSGLFFASDIPQSLMPGHFDHFFHSHQLFHFTIMMSTLNQMDANFIDFRSRAPIFRTRPDPTFLNSFGPLLLVFIADLASIVLFSLHIRRKITHKKVQ